MAAVKADQIYFAAFIESPNDIQVIQEVAPSLKIAHFDVIQGGVKDAIEAYLHKKSPPYLIIDISKSELPVSDLSRLSEICEPDIKILAIGEKNEVSLYRNLMNFGVDDYLVTPLFAEILGRSLTHMIFGEDRDKGAQSRLGKIIACAGSRGGVGSTFIATNFSSILASEKLRRVVIVDLDLRYGTLSLYLDLKSNEGLRDALESPERIDQVFIKGVLTPVNERLFIMSSEESLDEQLNYKIEGLDTLLKFLVKQFHYVIVDVPHYLDEFTKFVISNANILLLVTDPSLAGLRDSGKIIRFFGTEKPEHRIITIMNKYKKFEKGELSISDFEEAVKHKINHVISYNSLIPLEYINHGKTLVNEQNSLAISIRKLVDDVLGLQTQKENSGGLINFLKMFKLK